MRIIKKILKYFFFFLMVLLLYTGISILVSFITVNKNSNKPTDNKTVYLSSNGIHLSIILPKENIDPTLLRDLSYSKNHHYFMFGWGNANFYLNTPTWDDFKVSDGLKALFLNGETAIHLTTYYNKQPKWVSVKLSDRELYRLNAYIKNTFKINLEGKKIPIPHQDYSVYDSFYSAKGSYSPIKTCNTWVNSALKESGLKASYWTLWDFGVLNKYK